MRAPLFPLLFTAAIATVAAASIHSPGPAILHKRVVNSRRPPLHARDSGALAALTLINTTLANADASAGSLAKGAVAAGSDPSSSTSTSCFPALDFQMPDSVPSSLDNWWCDPSTEYAFMGFSYEVTACESHHMP